VDCKLTYFPDYPRSSLVTFDSLALLVFFSAAKTAAPAKSPPTSTIITMMTLTLRCFLYLHRHTLWRFVPKTSPKPYHSERSEESRSGSSRTALRARARFVATLGMTVPFYFALKLAVNFISPH